MCGVFGLSKYKDYKMSDRFQFSEPLELNQTTFRPHSTIPTVSRNSPNKLVMRHWSLIPPWVKDPKDMTYPTFNARSETIAEKVTFKNAWKKGNRCLVIATEFYEYRDNGKGKPKTAFKFTLGEPFALAGIYQEWKDIETVTIITCEPNHDSKKIHDRLPVIIAKEDEDAWLDRDTPLEVAYKMLQPYPDGELAIEETVSPLKKT